MQQLANDCNEETDAGPSDERQAYVGLIIAAVADQHLSLRRLALRSGIPKSRLGVLLHRNPARRGALSLREFHQLLSALAIDPIEAFIRVETLRFLDPEDARRFAPMIQMLCKMFHDLPKNLIGELETVEGIDGSEVRPEWAPSLQRAVIRRVVQEISAVAHRRLAIRDLSVV